MTRAERLRIRRIVYRLGRLEGGAAKAQLRLLAVLRREILAEIATASTYEAWRLGALLGAIDRFVAEGRRAAEVAATGAATTAAGLGGEMAVAVLGARAGHLAGVSSNLLEALLDTMRDDLRRVWSELGGKLKAAVRRAVLGVDSPQEAIKRLALAIRDRKTFASAEARAEAIVRTEVNRVFSTAQQSRLEQGARTLAGTREEIRKYWLSAEDERVRPAHAKAAERYDREHAIPVSEPFLVGGEELMHPLDPRGSARNVINCRCVSVPVVIGLEG